MSAFIKTAVKGKVLTITALDPYDGKPWDLSMEICDPSSKKEYAEFLYLKAFLELADRHRDVLEMRWAMADNERFGGNADRFED